MNDRDIRLWRDRDTPSLALRGGAVCYLDNAHPNYADRPRYVCVSGRSNASFDTWQQAKAWFAWIDESRV